MGWCYRPEFLGVLTSGGVERSGPLTDLLRNPCGIVKIN